MRILIVEDEFLIALDIEDVVRSLGHEVVGPVGSSEQARELATEADVALVDVRLNDGITGPEVAAHLWSEHGVTVVFMTGNPESVRSSKVALGVLQKPFRPHQVAEVVSYAVGRRAGKDPLPPQDLELFPAA